METLKKGMLFALNKINTPREREYAVCEISYGYPCVPYWTGSR